MALCLPLGDKISYFLEEDAIDEHGKLTREKQKSVNKIGHGELVRKSLFTNMQMTDLSPGAPCSTA